MKVDFECGDAVRGKLFHIVRKMEIAERLCGPRDRAVLCSAAFDAT
jgi:hypothetical protein